MDEPLLHFLTELRKRLIRCFLAIGIIFAILLYFANDLYTLLALPVINRLPDGHGLIATQITAPFFVPFELSFITAAFLAVPIILYQLWAFIAPALYKQEKKMIWPLFLLSLILFYLGIAFAYFVIFPILFQFFIQSVPKGVLLSPDISQYLNFTMKFFLMFGLAFQVPILTIVLIWTKTVSREKLISLRPYIIVGAFMIGMLLTPPDVLSQTLLAVPLWLLFEIGIFFAPFVIRRKISENGSKRSGGL